LSKCLATLSEGLGVQIKVFNTGIRTSLGDKVADDLSKGKIAQVMLDLPGSKNISNRVSRVMLTWLRTPQVDMELGRAVLKEQAARLAWMYMWGFLTRALRWNLVWIAKTSKQGFVFSIFTNIDCFQDVWGIKLRGLA
jgi:hypothetical protein